MRPELSSEDKRLLGLIAQGYTQDQAAFRTGLSARTIRRRLDSICKQLSVERPTQAVAIASRLYLIKSPLEKETRT